MFLKWGGGREARRDCQTPKDIICVNKGKRMKIS